MSREVLVGFTGGREKAWVAGSPFPGNKKLKGGRQNDRKNETKLCYS